MRRIALLLAILVLTCCDNFQEFAVRNPCDFDVTVAFQSDVNQPTDEPWPYPNVVPAHGELEIITGAYAGVSRLAVQIRASDRPAMIRTIPADDDPQPWQIPESFCRD